MRGFLINVLAVAGGLVVGSCVNMGLILLGPVIVPPPPGADLTTPEGLAQALPLLQPKHFLFPFLAHAAGTFAGALVTHLVAVNRRNFFAWVIGAVFLAGGVMASFMIPAPGWFVAVDLVLAYLPAAWLAIRLGARLRRPAPVSNPDDRRSPEKFSCG